jgi:hypothetical protein
MRRSRLSGKSLERQNMHSSNSLLGCWQLAGSPAAIDFGERAEMQLEASGRMTYGIFEKGRWQIVLLTFRVDGDCIVSNQASAPAEERTRFSFLAPDMLQLEHAGSLSTFKRIPSCSFRTIPEKRGFLERLGLKKRTF